jgi:hypothetical protein
MTLQALLLSTDFIIQLVVVGCYIIGASATIFGLYDIKHLKWTGDLKVMISALLTTSGILVTCAILLHSNIQGNIAIATTIFLIASVYFTIQLKNPSLAHEPRKQKTIRQILTKK